MIRNNDQIAMDTVQYSKHLNRYKKTDSISIQMVPLIKRKKSDRWFYKRKRYVILFCVLCFFFLYYQIVSFIRLSWDASDNAESTYLSKNNNKITKEELEFIKGKNRASNHVVILILFYLFDYRSSIDLYARRSRGEVEALY